MRNSKCGSPKNKFSKSEDQPDQHLERTVDEAQKVMAGSRGSSCVLMTWQLVAQVEGTLLEQTIISSGLEQEHS